MSLLAVQGGATGTGTVTLLAPVTNTNRTLTLPDATGTVLDSTGGTTQTALTVTNGASIQGLTVGRGAGAVASNTAVGYQAGYANTTGTALVAVGYKALDSNTTGNSNTAVGAETLNANTTGTNNTAVGNVAMAASTTGSFNTALGDVALRFNTTASNNTAVGYQALYANTTGKESVAFGRSAGLSQTTAVSNCFIGTNAGGGVTTGGYNTFIGSGETGVTAGAGEFVTTGTKNTILGRFSGNQGGLDIRTASNYIVLSDGDGNPKAWIGAGNNNDLFRVGTTSTSTPDWMHQISYSQTSRFTLGVTNDVSGGNPSGISIRYPNSGDTSGTNFFLYCYSTAGQRFGVKNDGGINNFSANNTNLSDRREKTNFAPAKSYLDTICAIPVQTFNYVDQDMEEDPGLTLGVVAQDVQEVAPELVTESNWGTKEEPKMRLSIYQTDLQYALMKAIQELNAKVDAQAAEIAALKGQP